MQQQQRSQLTAAAAVAGIDADADVAVVAALAVVAACDVFFPVRHKLHLQAQGMTGIVEHSLFASFNMIATRTHLLGRCLLCLVHWRDGWIAHPKIHGSKKSGRVTRFWSFAWREVHAHAALQRKQQHIIFNQRRTAELESL